MAQRALNSTEINKFIGSKIVKARLEESIRQQDLANYLGISRIAMSSYETGRTRIAIPHLVMLSKALGRSIEYFIEGIFEKSNKSISNLPKKEITYDINDNIDFSLEMSLKAYISKSIKDKEIVTKLTNEIIESLDKKINDFI